MNVGMIVGIVLGCIIIFGALLMFRNRSWRRKDIKKWENYPKTTVKITGTIQKGQSSDYDGYYYDAEILVDGKWYRAKSWDSFMKKRTCENGEELSVAYKPIPDSKVTDSIMGAMTKTLLNEEWDDSKPRYYFKILDEKKYLNEEKGDFGEWFLLVFGVLVIIVSIACRNS